MSRVEERAKAIVASREPFDFPLSASRSAEANALSTRILAVAARTGLAADFHHTWLSHRSTWVYEVLGSMRDVAGKVRDLLLCQEELDRLSPEERQGLRNTTFAR